MSKAFSILGKNIKANTKAELEPYISQLEEMEDVEEVHFGGNSLGVEACEAIASVLKKKTNLKVRLLFPCDHKCPCSYAGCRLGRYLYRPTHL